MSKSLSRQLASFTASLAYDRLPPKVVDKLKALTLHGLVISMVGAGTPQGKAAIGLVKAEEGFDNGATILADGSKATRMGAAFANSVLMHATNQSDSYRMLIHPGATIISAALATAELQRSTCKEFLTALAAAYEVETRIAGDFIPSTQARGFRSSPVYGVFGAAVATGKLLQLTEDQLVTTIALAATYASGTGEGPRTGGQEMMFHEPNAARNGVMAGLLAREGIVGSETALEGEAGFYHAFTGNNRGELSYVFDGPNTTDLALVTEDLGDRYELLNITPKIYPTAGYNIPVIELMARLKADHKIDPQHVEKITLDMNWLETLYPSPAFPDPGRSQPRVGSTHYLAAYTCIHGSYPLAPPTSDLGDAQAMALMHKVDVVGHKDRKPFAPRIAVDMADGSIFQDQFTGKELKWDLATEVRRIVEIFPSLPAPLSQLEELVSTVTDLDQLDGLAPLLQLCTLPK